MHRRKYLEAPTTSSGLIDLLMRKALCSPPPTLPLSISCLKAALLGGLCPRCCMVDRPQRKAGIISSAACSLCSKDRDWEHSGKRREGSKAWSHTWLHFVWQGPLVCAFFLWKKKKKNSWKEPGEPDQMFKCTGREPKPDFSARNSTVSSLHCC